MFLVWVVFSGCLVVVVVVEAFFSMLLVAFWTVLVDSAPLVVASLLY